MQTIAPKPTTQVTFKHREWDVIPDTAHPHCFTLKEIRTGKLLGTFILPKGGNPTLLNLISAAPELEDIAEMYHDHMEGGEMQESMVFEIVSEVLGRLNATSYTKN
ncbi:MAG: hypothetical protein AAF934_10005 [Bacteroidota bacterium]